MISAWVYPFFTFVVAPVVGYLVSRWQLRDQLTAKATEPPVDTLKSLLAARDHELTEVRGQLHAFVNNHLEHDRQEREAASAERENALQIMTTLQEQQKGTVDALAAINAKLDAEVVARQVLADKVSAVSERLARLEGPGKAGS